MEDNSIITKFELSEKEKRLRSNFFNSLPLTLTATKEGEEKQNLFQNISDYDINKFLNDNSELSKQINKETKQKIKSINPQQMNIIYSQNKLMERNVDLLQELQRSQHNFFMYNMHKEDQEKKIEENKKMKDLVLPLYSKINEIKKDIKTIKKNEQEQKKEYNNSTINELNRWQNEFKVKPEKILSSIPSNNFIGNTDGKTNQNTPFMKVINEIKDTVGSMSKEINCIGNNFNDQLKKVMEDTNKRQLNNIIGNGISFNGSGVASENLKKKILDDIDYNEFKNEIIDINLRKEELMNDFKKNQPIVPKISKPKGKIKFNYNLDYTMNRSTNFDNSSLFDVNKTKNIFNQNLSTNQPMTKILISSNSQFANKPTQNPTIPNNKTIISTNIVNEPKDKFFKKENYNSQKEKEEEEFQKEKGEIGNLSVAEKLNQYKLRMAKMENKMNRVPYIEKNKNQCQINEESSINPFDLDKYHGNIKERGTYDSLFHKAQENNYEYNTIPKQKYEKSNLGGGSELKPIDRQQITMVEVAPKEIEKAKKYSDILIKICANEITRQNNEMNEPIPIGGKYPYNLNEEEMRDITEKTIENYIKDILKNQKKNKPLGNFSLINSEMNNTPFNIDKTLIPEQRKEEEVNDNIFKQSRFGNQITRGDGKAKNTNTEIVKIIEKEYVSNSNNIMLQNFELLMKNLIDKFGGIEVTLNNFANQQLPNVFGNNNNNFIDENNQIPDIDEITRKVREKFQNGINVNVNMKNKQTTGGAFEFQNEQKTQDRYSPQHGESPNLQLEPLHSKTRHFFLGSKKKFHPVNTRENIDNEHNQQIGSQVFESTNRIQIEELDQQIEMPHQINIKEYDLSQTSSFMIDLKESQVKKEHHEEENEPSDSSNSFSKGQVISEELSQQSRKLQKGNELKIISEQSNFDQYSKGEIRSDDDDEEDDDKE